MQKSNLRMFCDVVLRAAIVAALCGPCAVLANEQRDSGKQRLKFRDGPVCMCSEGLSEAEIRLRMKYGQVSTKNDSKTLEPEASENKQKEE